MQPRWNAFAYNAEKNGCPIHSDDDRGNDKRGSVAAYGPVNLDNGHNLAD